MNLVSFGGGTNSTAMIIGMYLRKIPIDLIIFADTGAEQPHTYKFIEQFNAWLINHGLPEITTVYTTDKEGNRLFLEAECFERKTLPAIAFGFKTCSQKYKIRHTEKFLNNNAACKAEWAAGRKIIKFIGYDAGETRRVQHGEAANEQNKKIENRYPLYEWGWDRAECVRVIQRAGLPLPAKSSCYFCPSMKKKEIQALWEQFPDLFQKAVEMERNAAENLKTAKGLGRSWAWGDYYAEFMRAKEFEEAQISFDQLFQETKGGCLCGAPCGCYDG